jgi:DNA-binding SARP family transcriptional activator
MPATAKRGAMTGQFTVTLLGDFGVRRDSQPLELPPSCQRLVTLTALAGRAVHRTWICSKLWPDTTPHNAKASLRSTLWRLRPMGAEALLRVDAQSIALAPEAGVDWQRAVALIETLLDEPAAGTDAELIAELLPLLRSGELLPGWTDTWNLQERNHYHALRWAALDLLRRSVSDHPSHVRGPRTHCASSLEGRT